MDLTTVLIDNGFLVFPSMGGNYILKKIKTPKNEWEIPDKEFKTFEEAMAASIDLYNNLKNKEIEKIFNITVRYNQGLGIEYKNLDIKSTASRVNETAKEEIDRILGSKIQVEEVRIRPKK